MKLKFTQCHAHDPRPTFIIVVPRRGKRERYVPVLPPATVSRRFATRFGLFNDITVADVDKRLLSVRQQKRLHNKPRL